MTKKHYEALFEQRHLPQLLHEGDTRTMRTKYHEAFDVPIFVGDVKPGELFKFLSGDCTCTYRLVLHRPDADVTGAEIHTKDPDCYFPEHEHYPRVSVSKSEEVLLIKVLIVDDDEPA